jgi:hypothetical protein
VVTTLMTSPILHFLHADTQVTRIRERSSRPLSTQTES